MKHQWEKSQRGARGGAQETLTARKPRKEKEAPRIAANTVGKQDHPLDATAQLVDSNA